MNKPSKIKKEFLKRIKNHRNKIKNKDEKEENVDIAFSSDFQDSMKYLMEVMKDNKKNRTIKNRESLRPKSPEVNLSIPTELSSNAMQLPIQPSLQRAIQSPIQTVIEPQLQKPVQTQVQPPIQTQTQTPIQTQTQVQNLKKPLSPTHIPIATPILPAPPYGILKGGPKPTYRMWLNKTQKRRDNNLDEKINKNETNDKLNHLKEKYGIFSKPKIKDENKKKRKKTLTKKRHCTIKRKYKLGRNKTKRKISVLIKNKELRARVQVERSMLRAKPLHVMKNYLYSHGLLKVGNNAPKDLIKKIYEESILAGDIYNTSKDVLIYNYLNKKDE